RGRIQEQLYATINQLIYLHNQSAIQPPITHLEQPHDIFMQYLLGRQQHYTKDITILSRAYQNFDSAKIYTIHGFCNKILEDYPFECQINIQLDTIVNKAGIIEEIVRDFMRSEIISKINTGVDVVIKNLNQLFPSSNYIISLEQKIVQTLPNDLFKIENNSYKLKYKLNAKPTLELLFNPELEDELLAKAQFLAYLINYMLDKYPNYCAKTNTISYDELIQKVSDSLEHSSFLSDQLFNQYPVAFIDEFQDTDSLQWQIFSTVYHLKESNKRGNVVVVGDPKQAIYGFRGADVGTYIEAKTKIDNQLSLVHNFRSHPNIMNFINQLFNLANQNSQLENSFLGNKIDYYSISAKAEQKIVLPTAKLMQQTLLSACGIECNFYDAEVQIVTINGKTKAERIDKLLLSMTFEILALLKTDPSLKNKIAILVTKNREGSQIVEYLRKYGIKAAELKLGNIFATTIAKNFYWFLNAIADLNNHRNFIKAIATTLFSLPLVVLSENSDNSVLQRLQEDFFIYQQIWNSQGIISLTYALVNNLVEQSYSVQFLNHRDLANLWQVAELLNDKKLNNQTELLYWFKQKIIAADNNLAQNLEESNEELVRLDNDDEQIIVTTQHRAKGLEYEILFCPYFKNSIMLDGLYDFNYKRPFFSNYRNLSPQDLMNAQIDNSTTYTATGDLDTINSEMVIDKDVGEYIVNNDNKEAHRLNYVALTRAKSRLYIYLKQHTYSSKTGNYNTLERPDKIVELFGYVKNDSKNQNHQLFNYPNFFSDNPQDAIKDAALFPGVSVYNRDVVLREYLDSLCFNEIAEPRTNFNYVNNWFRGSLPAFYRQSYSALTAKHASYQGIEYSDAKYHDMLQRDTYDENIGYLTVMEYNYSILTDPNLKGAVFGTLFHELCEKYPCDTATIVTILKQYNINYTTTNYVEELAAMLELAFSYPLIEGNAINNFVPRMAELEFNLQIKHGVTINREVTNIIGQYWGNDHPFTVASRTLDKIEPGFLVGFIDLLFEYQGKYWVLDYKTNSLNDYTSPLNIYQADNIMIQSMAEHHYYLQYLLYLVAVKRYLQQRLNMDDATHLIGGAVYYYVRGIYCKGDEITNKNLGVYLDKECAALIRQLDNLFIGGI
ncbi:MAG: UvrD-helicase domain-containing protein, partial [Burkholderiales bacterium]|nr:UvrD-helicase domain-containing protein [Burkholderiales bacterium]